MMHVPMQRIFFCASSSRELLGLRGTAHHREHARGRGPVGVGARGDRVGARPVPWTCTSWTLRP